MSDEIIKTVDKKDDTPLQVEVKPKKSLASIFFRKYNPTEGLYITQYSWDKDGGNVYQPLPNLLSIVAHRFKAAIHI